MFTDIRYGEEKRAENNYRKRLGPSYCASYCVGTVKTTYCVVVVVWEQLKAAQKQVQHQANQCLERATETLAESTGRYREGPRHHFARMKHREPVKWVCMSNLHNGMTLIASKKWDPATQDGDMWDSSKREEWTKRGGGRW